MINFDKLKAGTLLIQNPALIKSKIHKQDLGKLKYQSCLGGIIKVFSQEKNIERLFYKEDLIMFENKLYEIF